jgi:hypothetical protein
LDKPGNKAEAVGSFVKKSARYAKSEFLLTKEIARNFKEWNRSAIDDRQQRLSSLALKRWSA